MAVCAVNSSQMEQRTGPVALSRALPVDAHRSWGAAASRLHDRKLLHTTAVHCTIVSSSSRQPVVMLVALVCSDRKVHYKFHCHMRGATLLALPEEPPPRLCMHTNASAGCRHHACRGRHSVMSALSILLVRKCSPAGK